MTAKYGNTWPVVHNSYLITWSGQGTVGFAFLVGLYLCTLWTGIKSARHVLDDFVYALNLGATCGIVAIMVPTRRAPNLRVKTMTGCRLGQFAADA